MAAVRRLGDLWHDQLPGATFLSRCTFLQYSADCQLMRHATARWLSVCSQHPDLQVHSHSRAWDSSRLPSRAAVRHGACFPPSARRWLFSAATQVMLHVPKHVPAAQNCFTAHHSQRMGLTCRLCGCTGRWRPRQSLISHINSRPCHNASQLLTSQRAASSHKALQEIKQARTCRLCGCTGRWRPRQPLGQPSCQRWPGPSCAASPQPPWHRYCTLPEPAAAADSEVRLGKKGRVTMHRGIRDGRSVQDGAASAL